MILGIIGVMVDFYQLLVAEDRFNGK